MARRASSNINAPLIIGIIAAVLLLAGGGVLALRGKKESFTDAPALRMDEFQDNGNSMRGMTFRIEGKVQTRYARDGGLGLDLEIDEDGIMKHLFVIVPRKVVGDENINRDQRWAFKIKFEEGGIAIATAVKRL